MTHAPLFPSTPTGLPDQVRVPDPLGADVEAVRVEVGDEAGHDGSPGRAGRLAAALYARLLQLYIRHTKCVQRGTCSGSFRGATWRRTDPRAAVERAARELLRRLAERADPPTLRVAEVEGAVACLIQVWDARRLMPTVGAERSGGRSGGGPSARRTCWRSCGRRVGRSPERRFCGRLRLAEKHHGPGTVAKALADLHRDGGTREPQGDKRYRMPEWRRKTPGLFD